MNRNRTLGIAALLALAVAATVAVAALAGGSGAADPGATPLPSPAATEPPVGQPPTAQPTDPGEPGQPAPIRIGLDTVDGHAVSVELVDTHDLIERAASGRPDDGASVEPDRLAVRNLDPWTLELAWSDFPIDNELTLHVVENGAQLILVLVRPEPTEPTDAIGFDRTLNLTFDRPVSAGDVTAILQDGLDTPGN
jgi:hypothetical protein